MAACSDVASLPPDAEVDADPEPTPEAPPPPPSPLDIAREVVEELSQDSYHGRAIGTAENTRARNWLIARMQAANIQPAAADGSYMQPFGFGGKPGANIIGMLYPAGQTAGDPKVLLTAHYDGIDAEIGGCEVVVASASDVCNGAVDNATGVGAVLGVAYAIAEAIDNPVAIVLFDGHELEATNNLYGEKGLLGSSVFAAEPPFAIDALRLHLNFTWVGYDPFPAMEDHLFVAGAHSGGEALRADVDSALDGLSLDVQHVHYGLAQKVTDVESFVRTGWEVPFLLFTNGPAATYHSNADDIAHVSWDKLGAVIDAAAVLAENAANRDPGYRWNRMGRIIILTLHIYLPPFEQFEVLRDFADRAIAAGQASGIPGGYIGRLEEARDWAQSELDDGGGGWGPLRLGDVLAMLAGVDSRLFRVSRDYVRSLPAE